MAAHDTILRNVSYLGSSVKGVPSSLCLLTNHTTMNTTFDLQLEEECTFTFGCECKGMYLNDLWRGGRCAYAEIVRMTREFRRAAKSLENKEATTMKHLESLFFSMKLKWIRLAGLLRCVQDLPCRCTIPTVEDELVYFMYCEDVWKKFYACTEFLADTRIITGRTGAAERVAFLRDVFRLKNISWSMMG